MGKPSKGLRMTVGLDLGDRLSHFVVLDEEGEVLEEGRVATREEALRKRFSGCPPMRIALETGTHSPWVSRLLEQCGHEVIVANSRKLRLIYENPSKNDRVDALYLARLARVDPALLSPVQHRGAGTQKDLALLRSRDVLVSPHAADQPRPGARQVCWKPTAGLLRRVVFQEGLRANATLSAASPAARRRGDRVFD